MSIVLFFILMCISNGVIFGKHIKYEILDQDRVNLCEPECTSKIYCIGQDEDGEHTLLHDVQTSRIYKDGTEFVKKSSKLSEDEILKLYADEKEKTNLSKENFLRSFIDKYFVNETLEKFTPPDYNKTTDFITTVHPNFSEWISDLNELWKNLSRKIPDDLPVTNSYIEVPNPFVVAGGRFEEMYYWDSYWIVKGLLACKMYQTAKGIIENMIFLVDKLGYIPNGNRIYYQKRSQPPMLIQMAKAYYDETNDEEFIKDNLETLENEFQWWYDNRRVELKLQGRTYHLFRYHAVSCHPRPESYREDYELLEGYDPQDVDTKMRVYTGIRSGAESGWDFSSKHMKEPTYCNDMPTGLRNMNPQEYAYVELNSIIHSNAKILAEWKPKFGMKDNYNHDRKVKQYQNFADKMLDAIENVFWNETLGVWLDYDLLDKKHRKLFFASNLTPLWSGSYSAANKAKVTKAAIEYLKNHSIINDDLTMNPKYNGVPTTGDEAKNSKQQWDYPNLWAPLQSFVVRGLYDTNDTDAVTVAKNLATAFVNTSYIAYKNNNKEMFEKYSTETRGKAGSGGEYEVPTGFGWTNGYIIELFSLWKCFPIFPNLRC